MVFLPGDSSSCRRLGGSVPDSRSVIVETRSIPGARRLRGLLAEPAVRVSWTALWSSRLVVLAAGVLAVLAFGRAPGTAGFDPSGVTAPFGYFGNLLAAPFARWDSVWYLTIAQTATTTTRRGRRSSRCIRC